MFGTTGFEDGKDGRSVRFASLSEIQAGQTPKEVPGEKNDARKAFMAD